MTIAIIVVDMRRIRMLNGSGGEFSKLGSLVGFMNNSFAQKIDLVVNIKTAQRLDKTLAQLIPKELGISRSRVQELITSGFVSHVNGKFLRDPTSKTYFGHLYYPARRPVPMLGLVLLYKAYQLHQHR